MLYATAGFTFYASVGLTVCDFLLGKMWWHCIYLLYSYYLKSFYGNLCGLSDTIGTHKADFSSPGSLAKLQQLKVDLSSLTGPSWRCYLALPFSLLSYQEVPKEKEAGFKGILITLRQYCFWAQVLGSFVLLCLPQSRKQLT